MRPAVGRYVLVGGIVVVVAAVVGGLMILGSPAKERERRLDEKRVEELAAIGRAADRYRSRHGALPADLSELTRELGPSLSTSDPATKQLYEYRVLGSDKYELCAQFMQASRLPASSGGDLWYHAAGRRCFQLDTQQVQR